MFNYYFFIMKEGYEYEVYHQTQREMSKYLTFKVLETRLL